MKLTSTYLRKSIMMMAITCGIIIIAKQTNAQPNVVLTPVISTGLSAPMEFVNAGDGSNRIFIVQKGGTIRVYDSTFTYLNDFLTVTGINTAGERGLLSMAFHPSYATNGLFYVYYTTTAGDLELARYHVNTTNPNLADVSTKVVLITIPHPTNANHNGGELHFGNDGYLYLSTGDGGGAGDVPNNAQSTTVLLGKILRFNVNTSNTAPYYTIPVGNPYNNEIYDRGLRNPYRWSFDRLTHDMWIGDVGQDSWEEINYRAAATTDSVNYGWRCYEGNVTYNTTGCSTISDYVFPVHTYPTQNPSASITGGLVYRGTAAPDLQGWYLSADFYSGIFYKIAPDGGGGWTVDTQTLAPTGIVNFGETEAGEVYTISNTGNAVYSVLSDAVLPVSLASFTASPAAKGVQLNWQTAMEADIDGFEIEYSLNGNSFERVTTIPSKNEHNGSKYDYMHNIAYNGSIFYRLKVMHTNGSATFSGIVKVSLRNANDAVIAPNVITDGILRINLKNNAAYTSMEIVSMDGRSIMQERLSETGNNINKDISFLSKGMYLVKLSGNGNSMVQKMFVQ